jgi:proteasome lid subunit RPN8/RPN11
MLEIAAAAVAAIRSHGEEGYPREICGLLVGTIQGDTRHVTEAWPVRNAWEENPEERAALLASVEHAGVATTADEWDAQGAARRFLIEPRQVLQAMKRARAFGWDLIGVYHTHPNHPAVPSAFDRSAAAAEWSYVIVSVREGATADFRSWVVDGEGPFIEEQIREY